MPSLTSLLHRVLDNPLAFEMQQRVSNNYGAVRVEFAEFLEDGQEILDVGCSTGACSRAIVDMSKNLYIGIDIDPEYVDRAARSAPEGRFLTMDATATDFPSDSFDVVMYNGVLHHLDDETVKQCIAESLRVVRSTGAVLVSEPIFVRSNPLSTWFLDRDRGLHIRSVEGYQSLLGDHVVRTRFFRFSLHRFVSFVLKK